MNSPTSPCTTPPSHHRHRRPGRARQLALYTLVPACAAAATVWGLCDLLGGAGSHASPAATQQAPAEAVGTVTAVGQVVAISPESITTRSADGTVTTFAITPATTQITTDGNANPTATGTAFAIDETVTVLGVVDHGTPVATALADQNASAGSGRPMDGV